MRLEQPALRLRKILKTIVGEALTDLRG